MRNPDDVPTYEFDLPADPNDPAAWDIQPDTLAPPPASGSRLAGIIGGVALAIIIILIGWALLSGHVIAL